MTQSIKNVGVIKSVIEIDFNSHDQICPGT